MSEHEQSVQQQPAQPAGAESAPQGDVQASSAAFTARGEIPAVSAGASPGHASASDRAFGAHHGIPGGDRNVSMLHVNQHHRDGGQSTRLAIGGKTPVAKHDSPVYGNDGTTIGHVSPGPVPINAGQICHLVIGGHRVPCVFVHSSSPGWVPVSVFEHSSEIAQLQHQQSQEIDHGRHAAHDKARAGHLHRVVDKATPAKYESLFTKPHQQAFTANHAHDYFMRGSGMINLLLNIPTWTTHGAGVGERFGSAADLVSVGSEFHQLEGAVHVPLYHHNSEKQAGHLSFVYGYVVNNAGEKRLGWINDYLLAK